MPPAPLPEQHIAPEMVLDFLQNTLPFSELSPPALKRLARQCIIDFFPKGSLIFQQNETEVTHLYVIQRGGVKTFLNNAEGEVSLKDFRGEGEHFGALALIQNSRANLNIETVEDTFCFLFSKEAFDELLASEPAAVNFFLHKLSDKLVNSAYAELRHNKASGRAESALYLFTTRIGDIKTKPKTIAASDTVQAAAAEMAQLHIGSLLVEVEGKITGIVTDKDLRTKVVAQGLDYATPVAKIMASPVRTIEDSAVCFDALLYMMSNRIHHLAVESQGEINGIVTTHDIMVLQGTSPIYLFREIVSQRTIEGLYPMAAKIPAVVRTLVEEGAKANNITRMITIINDHILDRLLTLMVAKHGPPPLPFCWLLMGSEGRREQTFLTDQDNALIYADTDDAKIQQQAEAYFKNFTAEAIEHLVKCGFSRCPGNIMASNPELRKDSSGWRKTFGRWIRTPDIREILNSTIFFDFRGGYGDRDLADELRSFLAETIPSNDLFLYHLANDCLKQRPPLSFFRNFIVEKNGEHRNSLNLKQNGLTPFVDFARVMALKHGIKESNTMVRIKLLAEQQAITPEFHTEIKEAYELIMQIRLEHQLEQIELGEEPDNFINPGQLSDLEKQSLKEAFEVTRRLQTFLKQEFRLGE
ncbi:MAG: putative nucleotidyltransferase substrate binding domain-containing protein [Thermodesulfobacteriota bacterium]